MEDGGGERNEAISAVADDGFLIEEEDDYEDLYNDVNVGEGFLQSMRKNDEAGTENKGEKVAKDNDKVTSTLGAQEHDFSIPRVGEEIVAAAVGSAAVGSGQTTGYVGSEVSEKIPDVSAVGVGSGLRLELGQTSNGANNIKEQSSNNNCFTVNQNPLQQPHAGGNGDNFMRQGGGIVNGIGVDGGNISRNGGTLGGTGVGCGVSAVVGVGTGVPAVGGAAFGGGVSVAGGGVGGGGGGGNGTILFVGDLHWWTTDAELETELCKYGAVKEVKFFDEKACGKSKGYCQVEFFDPAATTACKEEMNGHEFNGRPCVVAFASPYSVKRMGEAQVNRNQQNAQAALAQAKRVGANDFANKPVSGNLTAVGNYQGGDNNRGQGRGNWGRGNAQWMGNRGPGGPIRNRPGGMGGRGIMGNGGNGYGQGLGSGPPAFGGPMMGQGFDPAFGPMGRMGGYGVFPGGPAAQFPGILSSFPPVGGVGLSGVAPHVNPAFFGRGMPMNGVGLMPTGGLDGGPNASMWSDPSMGGWGGEELGGGRAAESSYGDEAGSDHQHGEVSHERGGRQNPNKEKERASEREWSGSSDRRYRDSKEPGYDRDLPREKDLSYDHDCSERRQRDDRDVGREREREHNRDRERSRDHDRDRERERERDRYKEDRDRYGDKRRYRDHEPDHDDEWDRGRSSRTHSKSRLSKEEDHRSRSRDADYGKRRRSD